MLEKVRQQRQEQTNALASTIEYKTVGGKDIRSNKLKNQDKHLVQYDISQKLLFEKAVKDSQAADEIIAKYQQGLRQTMIASLKDNQTFMRDWQDEGV